VFPSKRLNTKLISNNGEIGIDDSDMYKASFTCVRHKHVLQ